LLFRFREYPSGIKRLARFLAQGEIGYLVEDRFVHLPSGTVMRDQGDFAPFVRIAGGVREDRRRRGSEIRMLRKRA
jgi:hypothetical protein